MNLLFFIRGSMRFLENRKTSTVFHRHFLTKISNMVQIKSQRRKTMMDQKKLKSFGRIKNTSWMTQRSYVVNKLKKDPGIRSKIVSGLQFERPLRESSIQKKLHLNKPKRICRPAFPFCCIVSHGSDVS